MAFSFVSVPVNQAACLPLSMRQKAPSSRSLSSRMAFVSVQSGCLLAARADVARPGFHVAPRGVDTARAERPDGAGRSPDPVDISVFRFTLGIPGFDDSDLPVVLGIVFGGLLLLNHFFSLNSLTAAQLVYM